MSFSSDVKAELLAYNNKEHCLIAEFVAIINSIGFVSLDAGQELILIKSDNIKLLNRIILILNDLFGYSLSYNNKQIIIDDFILITNIVNKTFIRDSNVFSIDSPINYNIISNACCKRAYIRSAFICCGSINDPSKNYHIEFVNRDYEYANILKDIIEDFGISMRIVERKGYYIVYCKEADLIVDLLNVMTAHKALLAMENTRVLKSVRNNINRMVNCETANLNKVVSASLKQIEAIEFIQECKGLSYLPLNLRLVAQARLKYPDASLKELGERISPPIGKSGVNHRLNKICDLAKSLKGEL